MITCKDCVKEDVCPFKEDFKITLENHSRDSEDSGSPIYTTVGCRSFVKLTNIKGQGVGNNSDRGYK